MKFFFYFLFIDFIFCISDEVKEEVDLGLLFGEKVCLFEIIVFKLNFKKKLLMLVIFNGDNFLEFNLIVRKFKR